MKARGVRNNNPGNIRRGSSQWLGMATKQPDAEYITFDSPIYGIRAIAKLVRNYQSKYGLNTVHGIISRWAPPNENLTAEYIKSVADRMGVAPALALNLNDPKTIYNLVSSIIYHENGSVPYSSETIQAGIDLA